MLSIFKFFNLFMVLAFVAVASQDLSVKADDVVCGSPEDTDLRNQAYQACCAHSDCNNHAQHLRCGARAPCCLRVAGDPASNDCDSYGIE